MLSFVIYLDFCIFLQIILLIQHFWHWKWWFWDQKDWLETIFELVFFAEQQFKTAVKILDFILVCFFHGMWPWQSEQERFQLLLAVLECPRDCTSAQNILQAMGRGFMFILVIPADFLAKTLCLLCVIDLRWNCPKLQKDKMFQTSFNQANKQPCKGETVSGTT